MEKIGIIGASEFVDPVSNDYLSILKQHLLFFDRLDITDLEVYHKAFRDKSHLRDFATQLDFLQEKDWIRPVRLDSYLLNGGVNLDGIDLKEFGREVFDSGLQEKLAKEEIRKQVKLGESKFDRNLYIDAINNLVTSSQRTSRLQAMIHNGNFKDTPNRAFPIAAFPEVGEDNNNKHWRKNKLIKIVINELPIPTNYSLEQIEDFRNNESTRSKLIRLQNWISKISKAEYDLAELEEEFRASYDNYKEDIKKANGKSEPGTIISVVMESATLIENIARLKFSKALKNLINIFDYEAKLSELEAKSHNHDLSFIYRANNKFWKVD